MTERLFEEARRYLAGGVDSPVRAFRAVGGVPVFASRGAAAHVFDAQGRDFVDYVGSWGPLIAGHAHPHVVQAICEQAALGTSFGMPTELETNLARRICERVASCERVRFVSSGTEATMSALRLARAVTGRDEIVKVQGGYHGHADSLLVEAGSGLMTLSIPGSPGVPAALAALTHVVPFNDAAALDRLVSDREGRIACVILEPVPGNMGVVPPAEGYLAAVRELTARHGVLLIFDEVMTGFRVDRASAEGRYGVRPDLSCFGKVIGGGLPAAAYGGRADCMAHVAPDGPVYQAGTLSGNPLAMRAGLATLELLDEPRAYERLEHLAATFAAGLAEAAREARIPLTINRVGSMLTPFFCEGSVTDYRSAKRANTERYAAFFHHLLSRGVYAPPSQFEAWFVSLAHTEDDLEVSVEAAREALYELVA